MKTWILRIQMEHVTICDLVSYKTLATTLYSWQSLKLKTVSWILTITPVFNQRYIIELSPLFAIQFSTLFRGENSEKRRNYRFLGKLQQKYIMQTLSKVIFHAIVGINWQDQKEMFNKVGPGKCLLNPVCIIHISFKGNNILTHFRVWQCMYTRVKISLTMVLTPSN